MNHGFNALGVAAALMVASLGLWLVPKKASPPEEPLEVRENWRVARSSAA